jgi:TraC protein/TraG P-loop domain/CagE, TrbE, VirB family, component of type IV transporter system
MNSTLSHLAKPITDAIGHQDTFLKALFERPESLSALLPYGEFLPDTGIFVQKDGSLGVVFEAELLEHEPMVTDQIIQAVEGTKTWFNLPTQCVLQILFEQTHISALDRTFDNIASAYPGGSPVSKTLFDTRLKRIREACNSDDSLAPLVRRCYVSLRFFPGHSMKTSSMLMKRGESVLYEEMKGFVEAGREFRQLVTNFQSNSKVPLRLLDGRELLDVLRRFFNPKTYYKRSFAPYNPSLPISDQLLYNSPTLDFAGIEREGVKTRTLSLKTSPQHAYPGGMAYFLKLPFPFKLALNFKFPTKRQSKSFFDMKEFFLQNTPSARARRQREEILEVQEKLAREDRCLHLTFNVIVEAENDATLEARVREVVNIFNNDLECETILEDEIGLGLCLNSLPLNYSPRADHSTQRYIRILRSDAVKFVPIFDSFRGLKKPIQLFLSRENNLVPFSLLENETSNHTVVLADSGSGKSAFIIDCMQSMKRMTPEPMVFVVDKKSSYVMASEYFDGDLTVFDRGQDMPFTPFRGVYDEEKIAFLTKLLLSGIKLTSPHFNFESLHQTAISKALKLAYEKKVQQAGLAYVQGELLKQGMEDEVELQMEDFVSELARLPSEKEFESASDVVDTLLKLLMPFYGDGTYARYFKGSAKKKSAKPGSLIIYDLDALDSDPTLQALMTMAVFEEIRQTIKRPENRGREGLIILEEIGMLGRNNPTASSFIVDFAETMRKLGFWLISLTPRPQNYFELEAGKAMWGVADNFLFLQMSADNVEYLGKQSQLLDEANKEIIKSLRTKKGHYADVFYMNKKKSRQGAFRYFQSPLDRWLAPTNSKDANEAGKALRKFKDDKWRALTYLAEKFPRGVETSSDPMEVKP